MVSASFDVEAISLRFANSIGVFQFDDVKKDTPRHVAPPLQRYWSGASVSPERPYTKKKGHAGRDPVSFFDAYGVSCRARAEEAHPTAILADSPHGNGFPRRKLLKGILHSARAAPVRRADSTIARTHRQVHSLLWLAGRAAHE